MSWLLMSVVVALGIATCSSQENESYKGYKILEVVPSTSDQVDIIHALSDDFEIDFWTEWRSPNLPVQFMLPPHKVGHTIDYIEDHGMDFKIINQDVGIQVADEFTRLRSRDNMEFDINDFNTFDDIMTELDAMAARCPAALSCTVETLGSSYEGMDIKVLRISAGVATTGYWIDSNIHAREWLASATVLKIMDHFTRDYGTDPDVTYLIDSYDWHFVPIMNPDGYKYCWTDARYWRKSRSVNAGSTCNGTDLNRNYDSHWSSDGTSTDPCSSTYHGSGPASDPETQVIQTELVRLGPSLNGLVSVHSYAQYWLHPWGYTFAENNTCVTTSDYDNQFQVANAAADAIQNTYGTTWLRGLWCTVLYPSSGTTIDYGREKAGIVYTATPELRGNDFVVPPAQIDPSFQEIYNGVKAMVAEIEDINARQ